MVAATSSGLALLLANLHKYQRMAETINEACAAKGCPPAFEIQLTPTDHRDVMIRASDEYRFEGFGVVIGFPPKMQFYVHHLPRDGGQRVEIGRFLMPIAWGDLGKVS